VDISDKAEEYLRENMPESQEIIKRTHVLNKKENSKLSWETRFKNVESLLNTYQSSKLVITSRLHCALPCLALGTPVLLLYDENKEYTKDRLSDYAKIVTHMSTEEFLEKGIEIINKGITNPDDYLEIRNRVNRIVEEKLENIEGNINKDLPNIDNYKDFYIKPKKNIDYLYGITQEKYNKLNKDFINMSYERDYWKREFEILLEKYSDLRSENIGLIKKITKVGHRKAKFYEKK
jgi:hypothetical protein